MAFSLALIIILGLGADYLFKRLQLAGLIGMLIAGGRWLEPETNTRRVYS